MARKKATPEQQKIRHIRHRYKLEPEEYWGMFKQQNNKCYVCGKESGDTKGKRLHVDHDHGDNKVRKLLCSSCNTIAARIENDPDLTAKVIMYLKEHKSNALARLELKLRELDAVH